MIDIELANKKNNLKRIRNPTPRKIKNNDDKNFKSNPLKPIRKSMELDLKDINNCISEFSTSDDYRYKSHSIYMLPNRLSLMIGNLNINSNECKVSEDVEEEQDELNESC